MEDIKVEFELRQKLFVEQKTKNQEETTNFVRNKFPFKPTINEKSKQLMS